MKPSRTSIRQAPRAISLTRDFRDQDQGRATGSRAVPGFGATRVVLRAIPISVGSAADSACTLAF